MKKYHVVEAYLAPDAKERLEQVRDEHGLVNIDHAYNYLIEKARVSARKVEPNGNRK